MTRSLTTLLLAITMATPVFSQELFPVRDGGEPADRTYDVLHYRIAVTIDEPARSVRGSVTTTLVPFPPDLRTLVFDAEEMTISKATLGKNTPLKFTQQERTVTLELDRPYGHHDTLQVAIEYSATPRKGLYFIQPDSAYPKRPRQIWSQGEDMDNHFWFPCHDFPNDRATTEMLITVPRELTALSNGALLDVKENPKDKTRTFHWKESVPYVSYLIMVAVGDYSIIKDKAGAVPLLYYVYPGQEADAKVCFRETPAILKFFVDKIGFPYPWEKYAQVLIHEFIEGGMENASATSLADDATVFDARARIDENPSSLIAHEFSHQWWGDVVTCKDWRHLWLNESFASYFDLLYHEATRGQEHFAMGVFEAQRSGINSDKTMGRKPIVSVGSYTTNLYPRGASVLHMLRFVLGEEMFWRAMNHYITKHQFSVVETNDFKVAIEEATGQNLFWFFDEWIYKAGYPVYKTTQEWDSTAHTLRLTVTQTQKQDSLTGIFRMPVDIAITTATGTTTQRVWNATQDTAYTFTLSSAPVLVLFDNGNRILKEMDVDQPFATWIYQAEHATDPAARYRALEHLGTVDDSSRVIPVIIGRALSDNSPFIRREAVQMLGMMTGDSLRSRTDIPQALLSAVKDKDPSVRAGAVPFLTDSTDARIAATLYGLLNDSSYTMVARALRALSKADPAHAETVLVQHLDVPSHHDVIAGTALSALHDVNPERGRAEALKRVAYGYPPATRMSAISILRRTAARGKGSVSWFLPLLTDRNVWLRATAANALGDCGGKDELPVLDKLAADTKSPASRAAIKAAQKIRTRLEHEANEHKD
jgi:aminopeptidase N